MCYLDYYENDPYSLRLYFLERNKRHNLAETRIRPFTIGCRNWLFSGSPKGVSANATVYSIIESTKANELNPYTYLSSIHL